MQFAAPLVRATLIRRYKRFLADVTLPDGTEATAHCANPGAMTGMGDPGDAVWLEPNDDPKRKLKYSWKLTERGGAFIGVDTAMPNRMVLEALKARVLPAFADWPGIRAEAKWGDRSRIDFRLSGPDRPDMWVEVKAVSLSRAPGLAEFPDTVTARGAKHLAELADIVRSGARAAMLYVIHRTDCDRAAIAADLDPAYAAAFAAARAAGVEAYAARAELSPAGARISGPAAAPPHPTLPGAA
ncbi:DNA/RNA nuclease SfsA [Rhodovulum sp. DZ06]|uniref:DNA/RNA nuclease SfsA n=1 Tax=Rhodovulum sp. DZ06 TaxID=3425126 RepID=UPI003D337EF7